MAKVYMYMGVNGLDPPPRGVSYLVSEPNLFFWGKGPMIVGGKLRERKGAYAWMLV